MGSFIFVGSWFLCLYFQHQCCFQRYNWAVLLPGKRRSMGQCPQLNCWRLHSGWESSSNCCFCAPTKSAPEVPQSPLLSYAPAHMHRLTVSFTNSGWCFSVLILFMLFGWSQLCWSQVNLIYLWYNFRRPKYILQVKIWPQTMKAIVGAEVSMAPCGVFSWMGQLQLCARDMWWNVAVARNSLWILCAQIKCRLCMYMHQTIIQVYICWEGAVCFCG